MTCFTPNSKRSISRCGVASKFASAGLSGIYIARSRMQRPGGTGHLHEFRLLTGDHPTRIGIPGDHYEEVGALSGSKAVR
jgi:hypothetical protein